MKQKIETIIAPNAIGPYSQAIKVGKTIYFSGQIPLDPKTMVLISDDFAEQTQQVFANLEAVAKAAGGNLNDIVKLTIFLTNLANFSIVNDIMQRYFVEPFPARTTIEVSKLPKSALVEVDAMMVLGD